MKRYELAIVKFESIEKKELIDNYCPSDLVDGPSWDEETWKYTHEGKRLLKQGCRGIQCKECWETEVEEFCQECKHYHPGKDMLDGNGCTKAHTSMEPGEEVNCEDHCRVKKEVE